jgi:hypothetical protein
MKALSALALLVALATLDASTQDLGAAAAKEKERRKKVSGAETYTNDDLEAGKPAPSHSPAAPGGATEARPGSRRSRGSASGSAAPRGAESQSESGSSESAESEEEAPGGAGEAYWRGRAESLRSALEEAEGELAKAQAAYDSTRKGAIQPLPIDALRPVPPNALVKDADLQKVEADLAAAREAVAQARAKIEAFEEEARRQGALPGWLR